jgi:hypothetical protein
MKWFLRVLGGLLILVGLVWILQGVNVLLGSMMSGHVEYSFFGLLLAAIGVGLLVFSSRRMKSS